MMHEKDAGLLKAKEYQTKKNWLTLIQLTVTLSAFLLLLSSDGAAFILSHSMVSENRYIVLLAFFFWFSIFFSLFSLPIAFYSGYVLEHRYELSNQTLTAWLGDLAKREVLSFVLMALLVSGLYFLIWQFRDQWWVWSWMAYGLVSVVIGKLFPIFIVPLFYRYTPLSEGSLKTRIVRLANRFGMKVENIYSLNLSKTTKKANAAFLGIGKSKRIVLGDTLISQFSEDEIEMVLVHELGHFKHHDIWKQLGIGLVLSFILFWLTGKAIDAHAPAFGRGMTEDIALFPLICFILFLLSLVTSPLSHWISRIIEKEADRFALQAIPNKNVFISTMEKLSKINLADPNPHPVIEFLLYDHPSIQRRIDFAKNVL